MWVFLAISEAAFVDNVSVVVEGDSSSNLKVDALFGVYGPFSVLSKNKKATP